jgi:hypothetical protein
MQIDAKSITYANKTSATATSIVCRLTVADFADAPFPVYNMIPGPGWWTENIFDTQFVNPQYKGYAANIDLTQAMTGWSMSDLQSVFVDNSINPGYLQLYNAATQQIIFVPAFSQGVFPVFTTPGSRNINWLVVSCDRINLLQNLGWKEQSTVFNTMLPGNTQREAQITLIFTDATMPIGCWTHKDFGCRAFDCSGTISGANVWEGPAALIGGTQTNALSASAYRRGFLIHNPITAVEPLGISYHGGIGNIDVEMHTLLPGQSYGERGDDAYSGAVYVRAATVGHAYGAKLFS